MNLVPVPGAVLPVEYACFQAPAKRYCMNVRNTENGIYSLVFRNVDQCLAADRHIDFPLYSNDLTNFSIRSQPFINISGGCTSDNRTCPVVPWPKALPGSTDTATASRSLCANSLSSSNRSLTLTMMNMPDSGRR